MLSFLLDEPSAGSDGGAAGSGFSWPMIVIVAVLIVAVVVFYIFSSRKRKKQEKDAQDLINAVQPGNKVKTIGGICGIVVEVDNEENTFVLETGTEASGKSYIKFDRQAIYQTDAVVEKKDAKAEEAKPAEAAPVAASAEAPAENKEEAPVAEVKPAEEVKPVETADAEAKTDASEKPAKKGRKPAKDGEEKQIKF